MMDDMYLRKIVEYQIAIQNVCNRCHKAYSCKENCKCINTLNKLLEEYIRLLDGKQR